jgi:hypothetical protein
MKQKLIFIIKILHRGQTNAIRAIDDLIIVNPCQN